VTFPLPAKTDVNGPDRHPRYTALTRAADGAGEAGDIQ
jgi:glutathione peroxidase